MPRRKQPFRQSSALPSFLLALILVWSGLAGCFLPAALAIDNPSPMLSGTLTVFDEDDPLGADSYDAGIGRASGGSKVMLGGTSGDKLPVLTNTASAGRHSARIAWSSASGGAWSVNIFRPGFAAMDIGKNDRLEMMLNGPAAVPAESLPAIALEDAFGKRSTIQLGEFLHGGLDADSNGWQSVSIPLEAFGTEKLDHRRIKHVTFEQGAADDENRVLWLDELQFTTVMAMSPVLPAKPAGLVIRSGDRSVTLNWEPTIDSSLHGYRIYRAEAANGLYSEVTAEPVKTHAFADVTAENGRTYSYRLRAQNRAGLSEFSEAVSASPKPFLGDDEFLEYLQATAFDYFWREAHPGTGMIRDRTQPWSASSIAATGFGLTAIGIGIDHGWITRAAGYERTLLTLRTLWNVKQGPERFGTSGYKGWYYHFLEMDTGERFGNSELSSIDSALLFGGVLFAREFFDGPGEAEVRDLAERIFARVDWNWMLNDGPTLTMGWHPESGFISARWTGYNEAAILYLMAIGAKDPSRLDHSHWETWTQKYDWKTSFGYSFVHFPPLFGHQYSFLWVDFRGIHDDFMREKGIDYFENSRRATLAQRAYCIENPGNFIGYGPNTWGLTACDGPGIAGAHGYMARGAPPAENDDGTIAPTAAGGSIAFTPEESIAALRHFYEEFRPKLWCGYGFRDAFNLGLDWWAADVIGIDQGAILIMIENHRTGKVWERMRGNEVLRRGLERAGFAAER